MRGKRRTKYGLYTRIIGKRGNRSVEPEVCSVGERRPENGEKLRKRIKEPGISYERIAADAWDSFLEAFAEDCHDIGKENPVGIRD
jgi:hypothetical protein